MVGWLKEPLAVVPDGEHGKLDDEEFADAKAATEALSLSFGACRAAVQPSRRLPPSYRHAASFTVGGS